MLPAPGQGTSLSTQENETLGCRSPITRSDPPELPAAEFSLMVQPVSVGEDA